MSFQSQNMITAPGTLRTAPAVFAGHRPDFDKIKPSQWVTWKLGATSDPGTTFRVAGERLCESLELESGERVLNVTAGNGGTALASSESLPFRESAFDVVVSPFGAMFAPDHFRIASEMLRVCRRGGRLGLTAWAPQGFNGRLISTLARYSTDRSEREDPTAWGTREYLDHLFGHSADALGATSRTHTWRYASPRQWLDQWRSPGGPLYEAWHAVDPDWREQLSDELLALADHFNEADDGSLVVRSEYLEFVVHKSTWRI